MSKGCLSCFKAMCLRKKQSKKVDKPLKAERLPEPVEEKEDVENGADKKMPIKDSPSGPAYFRPVYSSDVGSNDFVYQSYGGKIHGGVSSSPVRNDFHKVKTFDLRGVSKAAAK
ncbi:hypothetical protein EUTSA_v10015057mg [Eutrema salsugineum]|uniref:Uncharacterized protein n=1 Tax=Eutrema salsugineum TaxID=72664 RepID=V4LIF5_EUTSA|nr:uncharacterized protein LOC18018274 [Eutrema salsugineum]ESQ42212.1 hypothetical protein EUTSA_v10015057mg [Eutrema salsugineum]